MIPDINLLPQRERKTAGGNWLFPVFGILFILTFGFMVFQYLTLSKDIASLEKKEATLTSEKAVLEEEVYDLRELDGEDLETSIRFIESISYPVSPLIDELNRYLEDHAYLRNYSFREDKVSFSVDFETITDVSTYIDNLLRSPYFKDVIINGMSSFDPVSLEDEDRFEVIDRFTNTFEVLIDLAYLQEVDGDK